jgi:sarcosine oxidase subunit beta
MARTADIVIAGGGIMGAAIAVELAQRKAGRVWLLERSYPGAGETGKSGAILRQHYSRQETVRMAREGLLYYRSFAQVHGIPIGFTQRGMIFLLHAADRAALAQNVAMQTRLGVPTRMVEEAELSAIEPRATYEEDAIGCYEEDSGVVDPRLTVEALVAVAQRAGVQTSFGEELTGLVRDGRRVTGVVTSHGVIRTARVVLAAGPWSVRLLDAWHCGGIPLRVVRPQQTFLEPPAGFGGPTPIFGDLRLGLYWKSEGPRHTRVGALSYDDDEHVDDPDHYDEGVSAEFVQRCRAGVARRLPAYARATIWGGCGALYTVTPDAHPVIGPLPGAEGALLVTGFSGHGFKLAPAVGRGVAEWIVDGQPRAFPPELFDPLRFRAGRAISSGYRYGILG